MTTICRSKSNTKVGCIDLHPAFFCEIDKAFISDAIQYYSKHFPKKTIFEITEMVIIDYRIDKENIVLVLNIVPNYIAKALLRIEMIEVHHLERCLNKGLKPFVISNRIKRLFKAFPNEFSNCPKIKEILK